MALLVAIASRRTSNECDVKLFWKCETQRQAQALNTLLNLAPLAPSASGQLVSAIQVSEIMLGTARLDLQLESQSRVFA